MRIVLDILPELAGPLRSVLTDLVAQLQNDEEPAVPLRVWTEERDTQGRHLRRNGMPWPAIFEQLATLPGLPITSVSAVKVHANEAHWPYPEAWQKPAGEPPAEQPEPVEPPAPESAPVPEPADLPALAPRPAAKARPRWPRAKAPAPQPSYRTPDREEVLRRRFPAGDPAPDIAAEMNRRWPDKPPVRTHDVLIWGAVLGLPRPAPTTFA
jgi:hypothetical protein